MQASKTSLPFLCTVKPLGTEAPEVRKCLETAECAGDFFLPQPHHLQIVRRLIGMKWRRKTAHEGQDTFGVVTELVEQVARLALVLIEG